MLSCANIKKSKKWPRRLAATPNSGILLLDQLNNCHELGLQPGFFSLYWYYYGKVMIPTLHARLALIEQIVTAEGLNSPGAFDEDLLREDLALMDADTLLDLANDLL